MTTQDGSIVNFNNNTQQLQTERRSSQTFGDIKHGPSSNLNRSNSRLSNHSQQMPMDRIRSDQSIAFQYMPRPDPLLQMTSDNFNPALLLQSMRQNQHLQETSNRDQTNFNFTGSQASKHGFEQPQFNQQVPLSDLAGLTGDQEYSFKLFQEMKKAKEMTMKIEQAKAREVGFGAMGTNKVATSGKLGSNQVGTSGNHQSTN